MATTTLVDVTLGIRNMGNRTNFAGGLVTDVSAEEDRYSQIILSEGVVTPANSFEPVAGAGATMEVILGSGNAKADYYVIEGNVSGQGNYLVRLAASTEAITIDAADGSFARIDEIYLVVQDDSYDSSSRGLPVIGYRKGTAAASPTAPGRDTAWDAEALLATIEVPAAAADILACTLTDERAVSAVVVGDFDSSASAVAEAITLDGVSAEGVANSFSRSDHEHGLVAGAPTDIEPDDATDEGASTAVARADHTHAIATATATVQTPDDSAAEGVATSFARSDHVHGLAAAIAGAIEPDDAAGEGVANSFARSDHQHAIATAIAVAIGGSLAEGSSSAFSRADHVHALSDMSALGLTWGWDTGGTTAINSSTWTTTASDNYVRPLGWGSAAIVAIAYGNAQNPAAAVATFGVRCSINGVSGPEAFNSIVRAAGQLGQATAFQIATGITGASAAVACQIKGNTGSPTSSTGSHVIFLAIRTS